MTYRYPPPIPEKRANGLGIAGFTIGVVALGCSIVPCCGLVPAVVLALIGGVLSVAGMTSATSDRPNSKGLPIAGIVLCLVAVGISIALTMLGITIWDNTVEQADKRAAEREYHVTTQSASPPSAYGYRRSATTRSN